MMDELNPCKCGKKAVSLTIDKMEGSRLTCQECGHYVIYHSPKGGSETIGDIFDKLAEEWNKE